MGRNILYFLAYLWVLLPYSFISVILGSLEIFFAIITTILYFCCRKQVAVKVFVWIIAVISFAFILNLSFSFPATSPSAWFDQLEEDKYDKDEVIESCFKPHAVNSGLLAYYTMTHVLLLVCLIISKYGFAVESEDSIDTNKLITSKLIPEQKVGDGAKFYEQQPQNHYAQFY